MLLMDVDGVLTSGEFLFVPMPDGSVVEAKAFHSVDGTAIGLARRAGLRMGIISGRASPAVTRRAEELRLEFVYQGLGRRKIEAFEEILSKAMCLPENICYVGDDLQDLPILNRVGFPVGVANACAEVKSVVAYVTRKAGGEGAVREVVEVILRAKGTWDSAIAEFML
jgi:3-deoxy-D-manno-octulosonate 8-phosphate phosphatase (KDO 8-P phosphatase)